MKTLHFADYDIETTDRTSDAVLLYAQELAMTGRSDTVHITGITPKGERRRFDLLLGPASQIVAAGAQDGDEGIDDKADVDDIASRTRNLTHPPAVSPEDEIDLEHPGLPDQYMI